MKIPTLLAYQAEAGAVLPKQNPFGTTHRIVEVTFPDDSTDVRIKTTHGEWDFGLEDPLVFPRRQDGSTIDWTAQEDEYPTPLEVRVGDLLRPESTSMPNPHRSVASSSPGVPPSPARKPSTHYGRPSPLRCQPAQSA